MLTDLRFALRQLAKAPGFTTVALLTLAVGIGSATVVFSAINAFLFKPLPLLEHAEDRLLHATQTDRARGQEDLGWSYPDYAALRERATSFAGLWVHSDRTVIIAGSERPVRMQGTDITWDAFSVMGVNPTRGRHFVAADAQPSSPGVVLISDRLWRTRFGSAPDLVGTAITLNGQPAEVIGIMPPSWRYPDLTDVWTPIRLGDEKLTFRGGYFGFSGRALLKPGVTLASAQAEADAILGALAQEFPQTNAGIGVKLRPIREEAVQETAGFTSLLFGAVMFVFLIACVNVANLLLARAATRSKEFAIRLALGAERSRVVRQLVVESLVLGLLGGIGGLVLGLWGNDAVKAILPIEIPFWLRFDFDLRVFAFVFGLSLIAGLLFGLMPALKTSRPDVINELKEGGRSAEISGPRAQRLRNLLVVLEIALALVLLVGAGLMMRSFLQLRQLNPGFDAHRVLTFRTGFPAGMIDKERKIPSQFFQQLEPKLAALPGVESAGFVSWRPTKDDDGLIGPCLIEGEPRPARPADAHSAQLRVASRGYFQTLRIPLKAGRLFDDTLDRPGTPRVIIVDEAFARRHFGDPAAALGKRLTTYDPAKKADAAGVHEAWHIIVGVVGNIRHRIDRPDDHPTVYAATNQTENAFLTIVLRTRSDPLAYVDLARDAVISVNREIPIYEEADLEDVLLRSDTVWPRRFFGYLFTAFGAVAVFLACIGIYGVMTYNVTQRVQELGVRLALGAQPAAVIRLILINGLRLVGCGLGLGLIAAFFLANLLAGVLYGVSPHDPPTFAAVPLLLAVVALIACWLPSRRATLIEPNAALRAE
jgi:putative ABC transport system permease protein